MGCLPSVKPRSMFLIDFFGGENDIVLYLAVIWFQIFTNIESTLISLYSF